MIEIKCEKCGNIIEIDKSQYDALLNDVEADQIEKKVKERANEIEEKLKAQYEVQATKQEIKEKEKTAALEKEITELKAKLNNSSKEAELAVEKALSKAKDELNEKEKVIAKLSNDVEEIKKDAKLSEANLKEKYESTLSFKEEEIKRWKEFRMGDSTKDLGESLEQYCKDSFEEVRADAYPHAYFEKDNEVIEGGKADFIFRDYSSDGVELVSIIFDMKNQKDDTEKKHKNEEFFKKLDQDRNKKGIEYAVLVSTLEEESKLYNKGIVDVSHKYPKMFVVRPQFFLAIIGLIRNLSLSTYADKKQLVEYKQENVDFVKFQEDLKAVADKINRDYALAGQIYDGVDEMCNAMIKKINDFRDSFRIAQKHLGAAQNQLDNLTIKKLTKNNPTMKAKFEEAQNK